MSDLEKLMREAEKLRDLALRKTEKALQFASAQKPDAAEVRAFVLKSIVRIKKRLTKLEKEIKNYEGF